MSDFNLAIRPQDTLPVTGLAAVGQAFKRALVSQCHPKMLLALFLPFIITLLGALLLLWAFWDPLTAWLNSEALGWGVVNSVDQWLVAIGLFSIKLYLIPLLALGILLPISGILGLVIAAIFVMPIVLRHLEEREYKGIVRQGQFSTAVGVWNAIWVGSIFALGWIVTMPLWLIPPLPLLLPIFWWAFAFTRMLKVDSIIEHANTQERKLLWRRHNRKYWALGAGLSLINLFPPAWLILPVFSALVFAHFSLEALRQLRQETVIDV